MSSNADNMTDTSQDPIEYTNLNRTLWIDYINTNGRTQPPLKAMKIAVLAEIMEMTVKQLQLACRNTTKIYCDNEMVVPPDLAAQVSAEFARDPATYAGT